MAYDIPLYAEVTGSKAVARFTGAASALSVLGLPSDPNGRARLATGTGRGSFRIEGFVEVKDLPLYAREPLVVTPEHLWIAAGQRVTFRSSSPGSLTVAKTLTAPFDQTFTARVACGALTLTQPSLPAVEPGGTGRGYALDASELELFAVPDPKATPVVWLRRTPAAPAPLFWSTEQKGSFVQVQLSGSIVVSGWAPKKSLRRLPAGELVDELPPPLVASGSSRLKLGADVRLVTVSGAVPLYAAPKKDAPRLGEIEPGTEVSVIDRVAQWVSVMPKSMQLAPPEGEQFWAPAEVFSGGKPSAPAEGPKP